MKVRLRGPPPHPRAGRVLAIRVTVHHLQEQIGAFIAEREGPFLLRNVGVVIGIDLAAGGR